jgi:hypothetical protein
MPNAVDIAGERFGSLVAVEPTYVGGRRVWKCVCDCGDISFVDVGKLRIGNTKSCGCRKRSVLGESTTVHGGHGTRTYRIWKAMRVRCRNPNFKQYKDYGGRGITVCERWDSYENFLADMGEVPEGLTIDRIDNDGNYEPGNCRWITRKEQNMNKRAPNGRSARGGNKVVAPVGKTVHVED